MSKKLKQKNHIPINVSPNFLHNAYGFLHWFLKIEAHGQIKPNKNSWDAYRRLVGAWVAVGLQWVEVWGFESERDFDWERERERERERESGFFLRANRGKMKRWGKMKSH